MSKIEEGVLTEPVIVPCIFVQGIDVEIGDGFLRLVGWIHLATVEYGQPERRIVFRAVLPMKVARALIKSLRRSYQPDGE